MGTLDAPAATQAVSRPKVKHDDLLSMPSNAPGGSTDTVERPRVTYQSKDERFLKNDRAFDRQYAQLYFARLMSLRPLVRAAMARRWPGVPVSEILRVPEDEEVAVAGTVYKDMKLKPSILDEYTKDKSLQQALGPGSNFCADSDRLVLEDEGARMSLAAASEDGSGEGGGALPVQRLVTGVVLGVRGRAIPGGDFVVSDVCPAGLPSQAPLPRPPPGEGERYVALVSGLHLGRQDTDMLRVQLLVDFLTGNLGGAAQQRMAASVVHLVVAGGCVGELEALAAGGAPGGAAGGQPGTKQQQQAAQMQPIADLDMVVSELAAALPVDVMPGPDDPANVSLPQQPLHRALFPGAAPYASFHRAPNPHDCEVAGVRLLGSAGQPISDMARYSRNHSRLGMLAQTLEWQHMAPTAPDTLASYPFTDLDPFMVTECPHIYFAGGQPEFATKMLEGPDGQRVRLVCLPNFSASGVLALVNLATLDCSTMVFGGLAGQAAAG